VAHNVGNAHIHAEKANPVLIVRVRIEEDGTYDTILAPYLAIVDKPTHPRFEVSKSVKTICTGQLNLAQLTVLCQWRQKGFEFQMIEPRHVRDLKERSIVQLKSRKGN
jgi:hypothetical protein